MEEVSPEQQQQLQSLLTPRPQQKPDISSIVVGNISMPPELISDYWHLLGEITILSNLDKMDIRRFELMYVEWENDFLMSIPFRHWCKKLQINTTEENGVVVEKYYDLNELLVRLRNTFSFQLTRSKDGFTLEKLTAMKQIYREESQEIKKGWSLFGGRK